MRITLTAFILLSILSVKAQINIGSNHQKVYDFCFSKDGNHLIVPIDGKIKMFQTKEYKLINEIKLNGRAFCLAIDINNIGNNIVIATNDSSLVIWDLCQKENVQAIKQPYLITSVKFSPNDSLIAIVSSDNNILICETKTFKPIYTLQKHSKDITDIEFIDNTKLISSSADGNIIIWDIFNEKTINLWKASDNWVRDIAINTDKTRVASCGEDGKIKIWNISDYYNIKENSIKKLCSNWLMSCDFYDNSSYAAAGHNKKVEIFTPFLNYSYKINSYINKISFLPNSSELIIGVATQDSGFKIIKAKNMKTNN